MLDQLIINGVGSYDEYTASLAFRNIKPPAKKEIKETVPFSNQAYDFSGINGEVYWEERDVEFVLEMTAQDPAGLEYKKTRLANWLMNVQTARIFDPHDLDHYFLGTYADMTFEDDESVEYTVCTVVFKAYPYKIAVKPTTYVVEVPGNTEQTVLVRNESGHPVVPQVKTDVAVTVTLNGLSCVYPAGLSKTSGFKLPPGMLELKVANQQAAACRTIIQFYEEVF